MLCMTVNVVVGFLYILNVCLLSVFVMVRSRKFMVAFLYNQNVSSANCKI